jgi:Neutral/alkaline non-lysosomal ceramidase, N-terminal
MNNIIKFGTGRCCINPEVPVSLAGYFNLRMSEGILDDIYVTTLVITQGDVFCAIISCDLITIHHSLAESIYIKLSEFSKLGKHNTIITATHSHTAPEIRDNRAGFNAEYLTFLKEKIVSSVKKALENLKDGELFATKTEESRFAFNRRYWMKDGTVVTNPGKLNPEIDCPEGPIDPEILLLGIKREGKLQVLLANISNHSDTVGGFQISSDWNCFLRKSLESKMGKKAEFMLLISPSGNINHFDVSTDMDQTSYAEAEKIGKGYANSIEAALNNLEPLLFSKMKTANEKVIVGSSDISRKELEEAREIVEKYKKFDIAKSKRVITSEDLAKKDPATLKHFAEGVIELSLDTNDRCFNLVGISFGKLSIFCLPAEPFVEIGLKIKNEAITDKTVMIVTHSGTGADHITAGYIPNSFNYGRGGYEVTHSENPFSQNTADKLMDGIKKLNKKLKY